MTECVELSLGITELLSLITVSRDVQKSGEVLKFVEWFRQFGWSDRDVGGEAVPILEQGERRRRVMERGREGGEGKKERIERESERGKEDRERGRERQRQRERARKEREKEERERERERERQGKE